jgi:hypothetical protein
VFSKVEPFAIRRNSQSRKPSSKVHILADSWRFVIHVGIDCRNPPFDDRNPPNPELDDSGSLSIAVSHN